MKRSEKGADTGPEGDGCGERNMIQLRNTEKRANDN